MSNLKLTSNNVIIVLIIISNYCYAQYDSDSSKIKGLDQSRIPLSMMSKNIPNQIDPLETEVNYSVLAGVGGVTLGIGVAVHLYQANAWWQNQGSKFRIVND